MLKPFVQKALEQARTPDNAQDGYERLALILPAINDDVNALAAWFAMSPLLVKEDDGSKDSHTLPTTDSILSDSTEPAATAGATEHSYSSDEDDSPDKSDEDKEDSDDHSRGIAFFCDGDCGRSWEYADDIWICRDCLCVQLDTSCLEKLRRSELPITICDPKHEHLHVPPFDKLAWKSIGSDDLKVGSDVMSRDAWLAMLEQEWGIEK